MPVIISKTYECRHRNQLVATQISDLILDVALFPSGFGIHKNRPESVMVAETLESFRDLSASTPDYIGDYGRCIIKPYLRRNATYMPEYSGESFEKAFHVFSVVELEIASIAIGETHDEIFPGIECPVLFEICRSEVCLRFTRAMHKRDIPFVVLRHKLFLSEAYICGDCAITAVEPRDLL